jgi:hypothetical protein
VRFCFGGPRVGAERENFENMESLDCWKWHFQSLLYPIHTSFRSFYLDIQNHIVEYPLVYEVACSDVLTVYFWLNGVNIFQKKKVLFNLTQMKSLLINS